MVRENVRSRAGLTQNDVRDRDFRQRWLLALAVSIALHEVLAGLWPRTPGPKAEENVVSQVSIIVKRVVPTPRPTRRPTPVPTPRITPAPHYSLAPRIVVRAPAPKAAATPHLKVGGAAAPKHVVRLKPHAAPASAAPVSHVAGTHAGQQNGGAGTGAGAGTGNGGLAGTGSGSGTSGNGNGGDANTAPCADVFILPGSLAYRKDGTVVQGVLVRVILRDGSVEFAKFPYPFIYPDDAHNPFKHEAALSKSGGIPVQPPPPGYDVASLPAPVQLVLQHSDPATGYKTLPDCDTETPPP